MTKAAVSETLCPFCDKKGLPILPVRYAIARADRGNAPALPAGFGEGVTSIKLPADIAHYTLRVLRHGYLYTYEEHRKEWRGYVVNGQGYLYEFDIHAKTAPQVGDKTFNDACKAKNDPYRARCFTVKDADHATRVWVGFSDVVWTSAVLEAHTNAIHGRCTRPEDAERKNNLQCMDVAAWRRGGKLPHMTSFDGLKHVAEFAADGAALQQDTREYFKRYLPAPYTSPEDMNKTDEVTKKAFRTMSPMFRELLPSSVGKAPEEGQWDFAAWKFSSQPFWLLAKEAPSLIAWGSAQAKPGRPAVMGLFDPAGIAIDLNGLAIQRCVEHTDEPTRKAKFETAQLIASVKEAIERGAVKSASADRKLSVQISEARMLSLVGGAPGVFAAHHARVEKAGQIGDEEALKLGAKEWTGYAKYIKASEWETYYGSDKAQGQYKTDLDKFGEQAIKPLDAAYVQWLQSKALNDYLAYHFDTQQLSSGEAYLELVNGILHEASGRTAVLDLLNTLVQQDPTHPKAWLMRALALNHDPLIKAITDTARASSTDPAFSWADLADKIHDKYKDIVVAGAAGKLAGSRSIDKIARLLYQIAGPIWQWAGNELAKDLSLAAAKLPVKLQLGIISAVAKVSNPNLILADLRGMVNRQQAARAIDGLMAKLAGTQGSGQYRSAARAALDKMGNVSGAARPYPGLMLIDGSEVPGLANMSKAGRNAAATKMLTAVPFDEMMEKSMGKLVNLDAKVGFGQVFFSGITMLMAFNSMNSAAPEAKLTAQVNFAGGLAAVLGSALGAVGAVLEKLPWGAASSQFQFLGIRIATRAGWFTGVGTLLGAIGGAIVGGLSIKDGWALLDNHRILGALSIMGGAGFFAAALGPVLFSSVAGSIGVAILTGLGIVGLIAAVILIGVSIFKPTDLEIWLEQTLYFGAASKRFGNAGDQLQALQKLAN